jgi:hypothetical protein
VAWAVSGRTLGPRTVDSDERSDKGRRFGVETGGDVRGRRGAAGLGLAVTAIAGGTTAQAREPLPLTDRVLQAGELAGYLPAPRVPVVRSALGWAQQTGLLYLIPDEAARLRGAGFVAGVTERLDPQTPSERQGLSFVVQFRRSRAARAEIEHTMAESQQTSTVTFFDVPGIPGASGWTTNATGSAGYNVAFANGPFMYLVGVGYDEAIEQPPTRGVVIRAAQRLYRRVRGHGA